MSNEQPDAREGEGNANGEVIDSPTPNAYVVGTQIVEGDQPEPPPEPVPDPEAEPQPEPQPAPAPDGEPVEAEPVEEPTQPTSEK